MSSAAADDILERFRRVGGFLEGHFRLTSGLHSPGYLQSALVLQHPAEAEACGEAIADRVRALGADVVLSPALGGIVIGQEVARALGVRAIFAERQDGTLTLRRGFSLAPGEKGPCRRGRRDHRWFDARDNRGRSRAGARVVGAASIIDRSGGNQGLDVPYHGAGADHASYLSARSLSAVRARTARRQTWIPHVGSSPSRR